MSRRKPLARFEALAQRMVEGSIGRALGTQLEPAAITARLLHDMVESVQDGVVANVYEVYLHTADKEALLEREPELAKTLQEALTRTAAERGYALGGPIAVALVADPGVLRHDMLIVAHHQERDGATTSIRQQNDNFDMRILAALDAFLIVDGRRHVPLDRPFMTIGRNMDSDIVIDAPVVSRQHAQLRWRFGHFVLYDVGSQAGTTVNGQPVQEWVLQPGDIVYLAGRVPLIYGEGLENRTHLPASASSDDSQDTLLKKQALEK